MSATRRAFPAEAWPDRPATEPQEAAVGPQLVPALIRTPTLRVLPLLQPPLPRQFVRVPTHAVGVHPEHRQYPRAKLKLPLRLRRVGGVLEEYPVTLVMRNISSTGIYFLCPKPLAAGTAIEMEVVLVSKPLGCGSVVM